MDVHKPILITGAVGFIGFHLSVRLLKEGHRVIGLDNLNDYYDINLKKGRLRILETYDGFRLERIDLSERQAMSDFFEGNSFDFVLHMAAQAGVRHSLTNPHSYIESNLVGFANLLEGCRKQKIKHLVFASSSSVYGANTKIPFAVGDPTDQPVNLYGATKKANELMAYSYSHLYGIPCTGLRFFTVYGPWGRPDMAPFLFTRSILEGQPIDVFGQGMMKRDFTYIDDIVEGVIRIMRRTPQGNTQPARPPYKVYNIGSHEPIVLLDFIKILEDSLGKKAEKRFLPMQPGEMRETFADIDDLIAEIDFQPMTPLKEGVKKFTEWYRDFYIASATKERGVQ